MIYLIVKLINNTINNINLSFKTGIDIIVLSIKLLLPLKIIK